jgi:hypothetical protein
LAAVAILVVLVTIVARPTWRGDFSATVATETLPVRLATSIVKILGIGPYAKIGEVRYRTTPMATTTPFIVISC